MAATVSGGYQTVAACIGTVGMVIGGSSVKTTGLPSPLHPSQSFRLNRRLLPTLHGPES